MSVYLLSRLNKVHYDEFRAKVVRATSEESARAIANDKVGDEGKIWEDEDKVLCVYVSIDGRSREVLSDFNGGGRRMTDKETLAQYSSEYLANALVDCRYLCDSFGKTIATLRQEVKTNQSFIEDWNKYFPDMGPREIKAILDKVK